MPMKMENYTLIEYCAECPSESSRRCTKAHKRISKSEFEQGLLPKWCPLPKET